MYDKICSWENLREAHRKAAKGKRGKSPASSFEIRLADNLLQLQEDLMAQTYRPGAYHSFYIHEPKRRLISAAPFRDRAVHHALCNVIEPIFERSFIDDSYANREGKGTHRALDRAQGFAQRFGYVLQCDLRQFFPSVDHAILRETLARKLHDRKVLWLVDRILESGIGVLSEEYDMVYFPGDDLWAKLRPRGLPIGVRRESVLSDCSTQQCELNLLFHQQYPKRYRGEVTNRVKPAYNVSRSRQTAAKTVRQRQVCQHQADRG